MARLLEQRERPFYSTAHGSIASGNRITGEPHQDSRAAERRRRQMERNAQNQTERGIETLAPSGAPMEYCEGVYPSLSTRNKVVAGTGRGRNPDGSTVKPRR